MLYFALMFLVVRVDCRCLESRRIGSDCGPDFLDSIRDRNRVGRDPSAHWAQDSG